VVVKENSDGVRKDRGVQRDYSCCVIPLVTLSLFFSHLSYLFPYLQSFEVVVKKEAFHFEASHFSHKFELVRFVLLFVHADIPPFLSDVLSLLISLQVHSV
jgi:hypothetical protein